MDADVRCTWQIGADQVGISGNAWYPDLSMMVAQAAERLGADSSVAGVMAELEHQADCNLYLALVSIAESGWAEYAGGGGYRRGYWDDFNVEFEIGEVEESSHTVHDWRHPDGSHPPLEPLPFYKRPGCVEQCSLKIVNAPKCAAAHN